MTQSLKEEMMKEFREKFCDMERETNDFLKYKCNSERMTRPATVKSYGVEPFESFLSSAIDKAYAAGREDAVEFIHTHSIRDNHPFEHMIIVNEGVVNEAARTNNLTDTI